MKIFSREYLKACNIVNVKETWRDNVNYEQYVILHTHRKCLFETIGSREYYAYSEKAGKRPGVKQRLILIDYQAIWHNLPDPIIAASLIIFS